jgi:hypothetical protein
MTRVVRGQKKGRKEREGRRRPGVLLISGEDREAKGQESEGRGKSSPHTTSGTNICMCQVPSGMTEGMGNGRR